MVCTALLLFITNVTLGAGTGRTPGQSASIFSHSLILAVNVTPLETVLSWSSSKIPNLGQVVAIHASSRSPIL